MSQLGKIFLGIAALGAVVALIFGWLLIGKYDTAKTDLTQANQDKTVAQQQATKAKAAEKTATDAKDEATKKLTDATAKVDDLTTQLTDAQKKADDAQKALSDATDKAKAAQDELDKLKGALNGNDPADLIAAKAKAEKDLETSESEKKILEDSVQAALAQVEQLKKDINASHTGYIPPGVSGKVTFVNPTWNFVVLNVGLTNGVVPNGELIVYRGKSFLGKIKVTSAEANSAVADILPDVQGSIQVGDNVLN